jgi:hypothetical protein
MGERRRELENYTYIINIYYINTGFEGCFVVLSSSQSGENWRELRELESPI